MDVAMELRYAVRPLRRRPGFALVCAATLALGIGASTAIFSAVNPIIFEPLPYPHADRILMVSDVGSDGSRQDVTFGTFRELADRSRSFSDAAVTDRWQPSITGAADPERLSGEKVSASYFRTLGVRPVVGRDFTAGDDRPRGPRVAIISDGLLRRRFGGDVGIIGRTVRLDGDPYVVIGVLPASFENVLTLGGEIWAPLQAEPNASFDSREWGHHYRMIARLSPGITTDEARRELEAIARTPESAYPRPPWASLQPSGVMVHRLQDDVTSSVRPALLAAFGAVLLLLAIACVNVTNLLLARAAQRRGEFALRSALGAGRSRLTRQLIAEALVLAAVGAVPGLGVALLGTRALVALSPTGMPRAGAIHLDGVALAFAIAITTAVGLLLGVATAFAATRRDITVAIQQASSRTVVGHRVARSALVVTEVALALVLLVGAGLLLRTLERLFSGGPGFDASHVLTMQVVESGRRGSSNEARYQLFEQVLEAVRRVPGVSAAGFTSQLPLGGQADGYGIAFESVPRASAYDYGSAFRYVVTPDYFRAMRIPLIRGRLLDAHDRPPPGAVGAVGEPSTRDIPLLINRAFAERLFPGGHAVGQRLRVGGAIGTHGPWNVVVGVVGDVKQVSLALGEPDAFYVASGEWSWVDDVQSLVVRTPGDPAALAPAVRDAIRSVDRDAPIVRVSTLESIVASSEAQRRFALRVFEAFAIAALFMAAIGLYGVLSGSVTERLREIGVRAALGAPRERIFRLVVGQGLRLTALGLVTGLLGAVVTTEAIGSLLHDVSRLDPVTYAVVVAMLIVVAVVASWLPAWRASCVDPIEALRAE